MHHHRPHSVYGVDPNAVRCLFFAAQIKQPINRTVRLKETSSHGTPNSSRRVLSDRTIVLLRRADWSFSPLIAFFVLILWNQLGSVSLLKPPSLFFILGYLQNNKWEVVPQLSQLFLRPNKSTVPQELTSICLLHAGAVWEPLIPALSFWNSGRQIFRSGLQGSGLLEDILRLLFWFWIWINEHGRIKPGVLEGHADPTLK